MCVESAASADEAFRLSLQQCTSLSSIYSTGRTFFFFHVFVPGCMDAAIGAEPCERALLAVPFPLPSWIHGGVSETSDSTKVPICLPVYLVNTYRLFSHYLFKFGCISLRGYDGIMEPVSAYDDRFDHVKAFTRLARISATAVSYSHDVAQVYNAHEAHISGTLK